MKICLDTNCVIYLVENNPVWNPKIVSRLMQATRNGDVLAVCDLARSECLVGPMRSGDSATVADYRQFFADPNVEMLPLTPTACERAAAIRAAAGVQLELLDCLHLASAIEIGCGLFLTSDTRLSRCKDIAVEVLA